MSRAVRKGAPVGGLGAKLGIWARRSVTGGDSAHVVADGH
jgi:hypothetical protein